MSNKTILLDHDEMANVIKGLHLMAFPRDSVAPSVFLTEDNNENNLAVDRMLAALPHVLKQLGLVEFVDPIGLEDKAQLAILNNMAKDERNDFVRILQ